MSPFFVMPVVLVTKEHAVRQNRLSTVHFSAESTSLRLPGFHCQIHLPRTCITNNINLGFSILPRVKEQLGERESSLLGKES
jgi:hypothetical protein